MSAKPAEMEKSQTKPVSPVIVESETIFDDLKKLTKAIERRAYEFFTGRGHEPGHELEDWFKAESEIMRPVTCELKEADDHLTVQAGVPGYTAADLKISIEPERLFIRGAMESAKTDNKDGVAYTESRSDQMFRALYLPAEVDPKKVTAELKDGVLTISLPKVTVTSATNVEVNTK